MILADTSIWIQFFKADPALFLTVQTKIEQQKILAAECIFAELLQGVKNERERKIILEYWDCLPKKSEAGLWIEAGTLSFQNKYYAKGVGLIDAYLVAFAKKHKCTIWSLDRKLNAILSPNEIYSQ